MHYKKLNSRITFRKSFVIGENSIGINLISIDDEIL